ncbi:UDP-glucuronosyltransferase 1-1 [Homalodisca vitripennis]|nr:UDP-glucuronosyltransferase 1-1 [Homalodisca vitripennis]
MAYQYCHTNDLVVNTSKTKQLAFGRRRNQVPTLPKVEVKPQAKFLGVTIDGNMEPAKNSPSSEASDENPKLPGTKRHLQKIFYRPQNYDRDIPLYPGNMLQTTIYQNTISHCIEAVPPTTGRNEDSHGKETKEIADSMADLKTLLHTGIIPVRTLVLLGLLYGICHGSRILVFYPGPSTSLLPSFSQLFQELARRGHQLTVVTAYKLRGLEDQNIKQLLMDHSTSHDEMKNIVDLPLLPHINFLWQMALTDCESLFQSVKFKEFLRANETYDLFIGSPFYFLECSIAVAHHLNLPVLNIYSNQLQIHATHLMGHDFPSSYVAGYDLHFSHKMNFWERSLNSIFCLGYSIGLSMYYVPRMNGIVREHFPHLPPLQEMLPQISVTLLNTNLAVHPSQPRFPGIIPVAGLTFPQKLKLPKELEQWMDKSENGVILFNVGSNINMASLAPEVLEVILGVFDSLPQRVLMKWEGDELVGKPANVRIIKCIPQAAVLAHPKCRMMITHGGLHSWMEAVHYSVPLLGILPSFLDQFHNLVEMQERGHGIYFKGPWTQNNFHSAINEVLHNYK